MQAMPGMTPDRVWALPFVEWVQVATYADEWAKHREREARKAERARG